MAFNFSRHSGFLLHSRTNRLDISEKFSTGQFLTCIFFVLIVLQDFFCKNNEPFWTEFVEITNHSDCRITKPLWFSRNSKPFWFCRNSKPFWFCMNTKPFWYCWYNKLLQFLEMPSHFILFFLEVPDHFDFVEKPNHSNFFRNTKPFYLIEIPTNSELKW